MSGAFDPYGPDVTNLRGPFTLASKGLGLQNSPGLYLITCGDCLAHVGTSGRLADRVRTLATLGNHRGSAEVLCAAFCTGEPPRVWWEPHTAVAFAKQRESVLKQYYHEPPVPRPKYDCCVNGKRLKERLIQASGEGTWAAGYIEAVFDIGERFSLLFDPRFAEVWEQVGKPPGPWSAQS